MALPEQRRIRGMALDASFAYFEEKVKEMELASTVLDSVRRYLRRPQMSKMLSLTSIERILTNIALAPSEDINNCDLAWGEKMLVAGLLILAGSHPEIYRKVRSGTLSMEDIRSVFRLPDNVGEKTPEDDRRINDSWAAMLALDEASRPIDHKFDPLDARGERPVHRDLDFLLDNYVDTFKATVG